MQPVDKMKSTSIMLSQVASRVTSMFQMIIVVDLVSSSNGNY
jgi:hypothetical protein